MTPHQAAISSELRAACNRLRLELRCGPPGSASRCNRAHCSVMCHKDSTRPPRRVYFSPALSSPLRGLEPETRVRTSLGAHHPPTQAGLLFSGSLIPIEGTRGPKHEFEPRWGHTTRPPRRVYFSPALSSPLRDHRTRGTTRRPPARICQITMDRWAQQESDLRPSDYELIDKSIRYKIDNASVT